MTREEIQSTPLVMGRFFEKPKCKPWDIVKGKRLACCHGLRYHTRWCLENKGGRIITVPKLSEIMVSDL